MHVTNEGCEVILCQLGSSSGSGTSITSGSHALALGPEMNKFDQRGPALEFR
jgi:hypothetical protein